MTVIRAAPSHVLDIDEALDPGVHRLLVGLGIALHRLLRRIGEPQGDRPRHENKLAETAIHLRFELVDPPCVHAQHLGVGVQGIGRQRSDLPHCGRPCA